MSSKSKKKYLADKINSLVNTAPTNFNSDDDTEDTKAKVVDRCSESDNSESNFQVSSIRRQNVTPLDQLDKRYTGKKISRKDVYGTDVDAISSNISESEEDEEMNDVEEESEEDEDMNDVEEESDEDTFNESIDDSNEDTGEDEEDHSNSDYSNKEITNNDSEYMESESDTEDKNIYISSHVEQEEGTKFKTMSDTNMRADIDKGNCVRTQLKLWESFLEVRIKLQKCMINSNQMPQHDVYKILKTNTEYMKNVNDVKSKLKLLLDNMLELQTKLLKQYPETKNLSIQNKRRKVENNLDKEKTSFNDSMDEEILSDTEGEDENESDSAMTEDECADFNKNVLQKKMKLSNYEKVLNEQHKSYIEYRNSVIQKWNEKTRISSGKINKNVNQTTLKQIEFALSDKEKLRKRVQLKRSDYNIVGKVEVTAEENSSRIQEYDGEIYDDNDFYHQLLRDLIEYKSSDITDPIQLSKQWIQLQNMRSKMKRKIDTRATKGRRIRYNVHNKLVNFMAPITINDTWTDYAKAELYNSLFGKMK